MQPSGSHLAEFNFGTLKHPWDDPRVAGFVNGIAKVNAIASRSPGFIWRIEDEVMDAVQNDPHGPLSNRPNTASTLSVWASPHDLWRFVDKTVHARFMARAGDWFVPGDSGFFVAWWVPIGHRPSVADGMARWQQLMTHGESDDVFGTARLKALAAEQAQPK